jgi:hypothetical protein
MSTEEMLTWLFAYRAMVSFGHPVTIWLAPYPFVTGASLEEAISKMEAQMPPVVEGRVVALLPTRK